MLQTRPQPWDCPFILSAAPSETCCWGVPALIWILWLKGTRSGWQILLHRNIVEKLRVNQKFRTAKWSANHDLFIDLISARSEIYTHPAALPTVRMGGISDDLRRRDFTINALAISLDSHHFGELLDEYAGTNDLQHGLVRVLHRHSFMNDPTRMYRAVRYEQRYAFKIVEETQALIPEACKLIGKLSAQRIRHELDLILDERNAVLMLARLDELGLLKSIHASLRWDKASQTRFESATDFPLGFSSSGLSNIRDLRWLLWLMTLSNKEIASLNKRLHFTTPLFESLLASSKLHSDLSAFSNLKPSQCVERIDKFPLQAIYAASVAARRGKPRQALEKYLMEWRHIKPKTTGNDLKKLGLEPGPQYHSILRKLRDAWLDGEVKNASEEKNLLKKILG